MTSEQLFLGACPVVNSEGIFIDGKRVIRFGLQGVGVSDVGDLLAYRKLWQPFIFAHLALWQHLNEIFEGAAESKKCPAGIFSIDKIDPSLPAATKTFCAGLSVTRMYTSDTDPRGIKAQWNAWAGKSSADILAGADAMLKWHQDVVMRVGGAYKDDLVALSKQWGLDVVLPDVPPFAQQQDVIDSIEAAYITAKGVLQLVGYGPAAVLETAANATQAAAEGLHEAAQAAREAISSPLTWIGVTAVLAVVGGVLLVYYRPSKARAAHA